MKKCSFAVIGGDDRNIYLVKKLRYEGYNVKVYGLENDLDNCENIEQVLKDVDKIVGPIPFCKNNEMITAKKQILVNQLIESINEYQILIAGVIENKFVDILKNKNIRVFDLMKYEPLTILNAIPTVEGAINVAIQNTDITIHNSNILVLGYGRIGKILSKVLKNLGSNVWVEARNQRDIEWIWSNGYKPILLKNIDKYLDTEKYDIIFNTIPHLIIDEKRLRKLSRDTVLIELASKPYGIDLEKANQYNIKTILASGLPGKVAPKTTTEYIYDVIINI